MDETYRMLGREHDADLEREAIKLRRAAEVRGQPRARTTAGTNDAPSGVRLLFARMASLIGRRARVEEAH
jgi:hypothetical protein